jgi:hypothetical protein
MPAWGFCTGTDFFQAERQAFHDKLRWEQMKIIFDIQKTEVVINLKDIQDGIVYNKQSTERGFNTLQEAVPWLGMPDVTEQISQISGSLQEAFHMGRDKEIGAPTE